MSDINHETLREQVSTYIRRQILQMDLKNGEKIIEEELSKKLGVSRGPIRESLRQLEQEGLIEYQRNRGCFVRELRIEDAAEVFLIRSVLECTSVYNCREGVGKPTLQHMEHIAMEMKKNDGNDGIERFIEYDQQFHADIVSACGMKQLYRTWDSLTPLNHVLFLTRQREQFNLGDQYQRHMVILDALHAGDAKLVEKAITEHYTKTSALYKSEH